MEVAVCVLPASQIDLCAALGIRNRSDTLSVQT